MKLSIRKGITSLIAVSVMLITLGACSSSTPETTEDPTTTPAVAIPSSNIPQEESSPGSTEGDITISDSDSEVKSNPYAIYTDLEYGEEERNKYDLYIPADASKDDEVGVILFVHGGSWTSGSKEDASSECIRYAEVGYITATMNYTLAIDSKENTAYKMIDEIKACVDSIKKELTGRGYNVTKMAIGGASAGGHLASLYAYSMSDVSALPVVLLIDIVGPSDMHAESWGPGLATVLTNMLTGEAVTNEQMENGEAEELINSISPVHFVDSNSCATVLAYGGQDQLVGQPHHEKLASALEDARVDYTLLIFPNSGHGLEADEDMTGELYSTVQAYLSTYFGY